MTAIVLIPARMGASRLPGKPLADIGGRPMIAHVVSRALDAAIGPVAVAAAESEVVEAAVRAGAVGVLTDADAPSGSDRILAALRILDPLAEKQVVVNLQGDMPFIAPKALTDCVALLAAEPECDIATLVAAEAAPSDRSNPNVVKAVLSLSKGGSRGRALYFTRSTLYGEGPVWRHIGVYAFRRAALERFCAAPPSELERREQLEQLRALELGMSIHAAVCASAPRSVDTPADLAAVRAQAAVCSASPR